MDMGREAHGREREAESFVICVIVEGWQLRAPNISSEAALRSMWSERGIRYNTLQPSGIRILGARKGDSPRTRQIYDLL